MSNIKNSRQTYATLYAEDADTDLGTDPASPHGFVTPRAAELTATSVGRDMIPVPLERGDFNTSGLIQGDYAAQIQLKMNMEAIFLGRVIRALTGLDSVPVARAEGHVHEWILDPNTPPGGHQIQAKVIDGPTFFRSAGMRADKFGVQSANKGPSVYTLDMLGIGLLLETDLGGEQAKDAFVPFSYLDGYVKKNTEVLAQVAGSQHTIMRNLSRADVEFSGGVGADVIADEYDCNGQLDTLYKDQAHYLEAKNFSDVSLEWLWGQGRIDLMDFWLQIFYPKTKFGAAWPRIGGKGAVPHSQKFQGDLNDSVGLPAELWTARGPFNIPSGSHLGIKVNGGGTVTVAITAGPARTAAQVAADIATVSGLLAAFTWPTNKAIPVGPRVKLVTASGGASASIQIDNTVMGDCSDVLGLSTVAATGRDPVLGLIRLVSPKATAYDGAS